MKEFIKVESGFKGKKMHKDRTKKKLKNVSYCVTLVF